MIATSVAESEEYAKTGISYLRVSTKEQAAKGGQAEGFSIPAQREANRRKAASIGASIVAEFVDAGESAKSADRPDLQRMLRYLTENHVDYVFVHKVDRLARNRADDVEITMAIKKSGATLVSATENIDETPSGMLMHGIMSSIAEFYSRNLANEVHKGMSQKALMGGTPGKVPLGYRNIGRLTPEGREERTVEIDSERSGLITWAFTAYATGDWTLRSLASELETRGLTTRRTPKMPERVVKPNVLHGIFTNPYYKGDVIYRGTAYEGHHQPLIDPVTWQKVQDVLEMHAAGEKIREHPHYLKSSVFCGGCGSRLVISQARNRFGATYPYFICLGRHQKRTTCTRKALLVAKVEELVEEYWRTVQLDTNLRTAVEDGLHIQLANEHEEADAERQALTKEKAALTAQRRKLVDAIYSGAIPTDLIAGEQERITGQLAIIEKRLNSAEAEKNEVEANLATALDLASDCHRAYLAAGPRLRRLFNQAFFTHLLIDEDAAQGEYRSPFDTLLNQAVREAGEASQIDSAVGAKAMANALYRTAASENRTTPGALRTDRGCSTYPSNPAFGDEGLKIRSLVPFRDSLSNTNAPLLRLLKALDDKPSSRDRDAVISTGVGEPSAVRLQVKRNRKLSPTEVAKLVAQYLAGVSVPSLSKLFELHEQTVRAHLKRQGVKLQPYRTLTNAQQTDVLRLYVDELWSLARIARKFSICETTVRNTLARHDVQRRARTRRRSAASRPHLHVEINLIHEMSEQEPPKEAADRSLQEGDAA